MRVNVKFEKVCVIPAHSSIHMLSGECWLKMGSSDSKAGVKPGADSDLSKLDPEPESESQVGAGVGAGTIWSRPSLELVALKMLKIRENVYLKNTI